jgi:hypothetical protein
MNPRHRQANGDFRSGPYHDPLDAGGNPELLTVWKGLPQNKSVGLDADSIQVIRDLSEGSENASTI